LCERLKAHVDLKLVTATYGHPVEEFEIDNLAKIHVNNFPLLLMQYLFGLHLTRYASDELLHIHVPHAFTPNRHRRIVTTFHVAWSQYARALESRRPISVFDVQIPGVNHQIVTAEKKLAQISDAVIAVSGSVKDELVTTYNVDPDKIHVIYNGIDIEEYKQMNGTRENVILYVGRQTTHKGLPFLIEAFAKFAELHPQYRLVLVGERLEGRIDPYLVELSRRLGIAKKVEFTGRLSESEVKRLMGRAKCFVLPSLAESFGMAILEAMASGTPVVGTNVGGIPEVVRDGSNGLLVPPADSNQLEKAIERIVSDADLQETFARNGIETCKAFSWDAAAHKTLRVYQEVGNEVFTS